MTPPAAHELRTLPHLRALLDVTRVVRGGADVDAVLAEVARAVSSSLGYGTVVVSVYRPAWDDFVVSTVHGSYEARALLLGETRPRETWDRLLDERFRRGDAYFIPQEAAGAFADITRFVPDIPASADPGAWQPEDALLAPLRNSHGAVLGVVSVDLPVDGRRPTQDEIEVLCAVVEHAALALEHAQDAVAARRHRVALERLQEVSTNLASSASIDELLACVCDGIQSALGFRHVAVQLVDPARGGFTPAAAVGWQLDDPALQVSLSVSDLQMLIDPHVDVFGCTLLSDAEARARLTDYVGVFESTMNGTGPAAWNHHWLLVPLYAHDGAIAGFIWCDDPETRLLPTNDELRALRAFADQAAVAFFATGQLEARTRHAAELAAVNDIAVDLVGGLDRHAILRTIMTRACELLGTPHGSLYLREPGDDKMTAHVAYGVMSTEKDAGVRAGEGLSGRVWAASEPLVVEDYESWEGRKPCFAGSGIRAAVAVPLRIGGEVLGTLGVASLDPDRRFAARDVVLLERIARLASVALENARLFSAAQHELDERRAAEERLRQSQELYRCVIENSGELITLVDAAGKIVFASPSVERTLGRPAREVVGTRFLDYIHPDDAAGAVGAIRGGMAHSAQVLHADGEYRIFEGAAVPIRDEAGEIEMVLVTSRDVTGRLRADDQRRALEEQLRHSQKLEAVGRLAAGVAHDFNNLLTPIKGYAALALETTRDVRLREDLTQIREAADRASALTRQLLAFGRQQALAPERLDLGACVDGVVRMLSRVVDPQVRIETRFAPASLWVDVDPVGIEQIVMNLAVNACDAMADGGTLTLATRAEDGCVVLDVADTGTGIDAETAARVFDPFFTTKPKGKGTGLGLSTVHGIVEQSGGTIRLDSSPGAGARFTIAFPAAAVPAEPAVEVPATQAQSVRGNETVLLVDDNALVRDLTARMLSHLGYRVVPAASPEEALALAGSDHFDVLVTDVAMPGMRGGELVERLASLGVEPPVLFISGDGHSSAASLTRTNAAHLAKPFTTEELSAALRTLVDRTLADAA